VYNSVLIIVCPDNSVVCPDNSVLCPDNNVLIAIDSCDRCACPHFDIVLPPLGFPSGAGGLQTVSRCGYEARCTHCIGKCGSNNIIMTKGHH
jgi:hypothetical protein